MLDPDGVALQIDFQVPVDLHAELFGKEAVELEVVVAAEIVDLHAGFDEFSEGAEEGEVVAIDVIAVFHPEFKDVANEEYVGGGAFPTAQKGDGAGFAIGNDAGMLTAQMQVGKEICRQLHGTIVIFLDALRISNPICSSFVGARCLCGAFPFGLCAFFYAHASFGAALCHKGATPGAQGKHHPVPAQYLEFES